MTPKEIYEDMVQILAEDLSSYATVMEKAAEFSTEDDPRLGSPKTSTTDEQVDAIHSIVLDDICLTVKQMAQSRGISSGLVHTVLTEIMVVSQLSVR